MALNEKKVFYGKLNDNVLVIDPNKVIVDDHTLGTKRVEDRYVPQEDLVMYAGLKAYRKGKSSIFDTEANSEHVIDFGEISINFLNPVGQNGEGKGFFTSQWTDVFTDQRAADTTVDPETFAIRSIEITQNASLVPRIVIEFTDVRGKTLLERGDDEDNPYNLFYSLPYPSFMLTLKGYYGKGITYPLVLLKTNTRLDPSTGDYHVRCEFLSRTFAIFNDFLLVYGLAAPYMFKFNDGVQHDGVEYQGMYILKQLYKMQNEQIEADLREEMKGQEESLIQKELSRRTIEHPVTIYDVVKGAEALSVDDLMYSTDTSIQEMIEARGIIDTFRSELDYIMEDLTPFMDPSNKDSGLTYDNGVYKFTGEVAKIEDIPEITTALVDIHETYEKYVGKSDNGTIKKLDEVIKSGLKEKNIPIPEGRIVDVVTMKAKHPVTNEDAVSMQRLDFILKIIDDKIKDAYREANEKIVVAQREAIKEKLKFDITMENIVRIFMNNMQTFLMLLNLTTKKAFQQIKNDPNRVPSQEKDAEVHPGKDGKKKAYPWPNYYMIDKDKLKEGQETYKRTYPGQKISNKIWPEVQFVDEIYRSFDRIKAITTTPEEELKATSLISPFLNVVSPEQYVKVSSTDTTVEIMKKTVISLLHDGYMAKNLKTDAIHGIADLLVKYDYQSLLTKAKNLSNQKAYREINTMYEAFFQASGSHFDQMKSKFKEKVNPTAIQTQIKAENDAFIKGDVAALKKATSALTINGLPNYLTDKDTSVSRIYQELAKITDPLTYANPGVVGSERTPEFTARVAAGNNQYTVAPFPGFVNLEGKNMLDQTTSPFNYWAGFYNTFYLGKMAESIYGSENATINDVKALTFNNKPQNDETAKTEYAVRYNTY